MEAFHARCIREEEKHRGALEAFRQHIFIPLTLVLATTVDVCHCFPQCRDIHLLSTPVTSVGNLLILVPGWTESETSCWFCFTKQCVLPLRIALACLKGPSLPFAITYSQLFNTWTLEMNRFTADLKMLYAACQVTLVSPFWKSNISLMWPIVLASWIIQSKADIEIRWHISLWRSMNDAFVAPSTLEQHTEW